MIKLKYTEIAKAMDLQKIDNEIKRLNDLKKRIENYFDDDEIHYDFEYSIVSKMLKLGHHIRAFYDGFEPTYILYYKTQEYCKVTNRCFNSLITNLEHRPSGRPCEECYVWKD